MVKAYEGKLSEFVIPVEELGFDPLVPTNIDWFSYSKILYSKFHLIPLFFHFLFINNYILFIIF